MEKNKLEEELSTKQHAEFTVSEETDRKHLAWTVWTLAINDMGNVKNYAQMYKVTLAELKKYPLPT